MIWNGIFRLLDTWLWPLTTWASCQSSHPACTSCCFSTPKAGNSGIFHFYLHTILNLSSFFSFFLWAMRELQKTSFFCINKRKLCPNPMISQSHLEGAKSGMSGLKLPTCSWKCSFFYRLHLSKTDVVTERSSFSITSKRFFFCVSVHFWLF